MTLLLRSIALPLLALLIVGTAALAQPASHALEHTGASGTIDWTTMRARATGTGVAPLAAAGTTMDPARAEAMAQRAAVLDARRNLLEVIGSVRIDSRTTVRDFITQSDEVRTSVTGLLRGSQIERTARQADGSWSAVVSIPLTGALSRTVLSAPAPAPAPHTLPPQANQQEQIRHLAALQQQVAHQQQRLDSLERHMAALNQQNRAQGEKLARLAQQQAQPPRQQVQPAPPEPDPAPLQRLAQLQALQNELFARVQQLENRPAQQPVPQATAPAFTAPAAGAPAAPGTTKLPALPSVTPEQAAAHGYTGIVLDARGLGFSPSLRPSVLAPGGTRLYPPVTTNTAGSSIQADIASRGAVRYFRDLAQAQRSERARTNPLTLRPTGLSDTGAPILAPSDAALVQALASTSDNPLEALNMAVVF